MDLFYNDDYTASKYAFDTTRKSKIIYESLIDTPIKNLDIIDPSDFLADAEEQISKVHSSRYINAVKSGKPKELAESQGFEWDKGIYKMAMSHTAGLLAATNSVITSGGVAGSLSSGLHHANIFSGTGFCTFNGLGAAAHYAQQKFDAGRILILDFDAHAGGGTWDMISNILNAASESVVQVDVTCAPFDIYDAEGQSKLLYADYSNYRETIIGALDYAKKKLGKFDLIIYNAGMDPLNSGISMNDIKFREKAVRNFIQDTPAIFALAGGYKWGGKTLDEVASWHRITIDTWAKTYAKQTTIM